MADDLFAGKYKTEEDLHKGVINKITQDYGSVEDFYKNLERGKVTIGQQDNQTAGQQGDQQTDNISIQRPQVTLQDAQREIMSNGEVSKETYDALSKSIPKDALDLSLSSLTNQKAAGEQAVYQMAGGQEEYQKMAEWAKSNLSQEDIDGFNQAVTSGNQYVQKAAIDALKQSYTQAEGTGGQRISGDAKGDVGTGGFESQRDMVAAMKDPRYKTDPEYQREVFQKIQKSKF